MSAHLPVTPAQIAEEAIAAAQAGGGGQNMTTRERIAAALACKPEMCSPADVRARLGLKGAAHVAF